MAYITLGKGKHIGKTPTVNICTNCVKLNHEIKYLKTYISVSLIINVIAIIGVLVEAICLTTISR
jgi:hypothetical protein